MKKWLLYAACVISILVMNVLYVEYQFYMLLLVVLIVPLISWVLFLFSVAGLKMYITLPQKVVSLKDKAVVKIKAVNKRFVFAGKQVFTVGMHYSNTQKSAQELSEITGISGNMQMASISFEPVHCGIVKVSIQRVFLQDYLGLFRAKRRFTGSCQMIVMPELVWSSHVKPYMERKQEYRYIGIADDDTDVVDLREFMPGDNLNHIHWNLSLRTDELIVRQYGELISAKNVILVDLTKGKEENFRDILDLIYTAVYSIANLYIENEMKTVLIAWNEDSQCAESFEFDNAQGMTEAMVQLMKIPCSSKAGEYVVSEFVRQSIYPQEGAVLVTATDYDSRILETINVTKHKLQETINSLWEKI